MSGGRLITAVVFDAGETLVDETRKWRIWADWLGVTDLAFFAAFGAAIALHGDHTRALAMVRPDTTWDQQRVAMAAASVSTAHTPDDLYPDALDCLRALRAAGYRLGIAGNQPEETETILRAVGLPVEFIATSVGWGVEKPSPAFFARTAQECGAPAEEIAYVGDRMDNDVLPARDAGMLAVFLRRGPWGAIHATQDWPAAPDLTIGGLMGLPPALDRINAGDARTRG